SEGDLQAVHRRADSRIHRRHGEMIAVNSDGLPALSAIGAAIAPHQGRRGSIDRAVGVREEIRERPQAHALSILEAYAARGANPTALVRAVLAVKGNQERAGIEIQHVHTDDVSGEHGRNPAYRRPGMALVSAEPHLHDLRIDVIHPRLPASGDRYPSG